MADITLINGAAEPIATSVTSGTVGELRNELNLPSGAVVSVDGHKASDIFHYRMVLWLVL